MLICLMSSVWLHSNRYRYFSYSFLLILWKLGAVILWVSRHIFFFSGFSLDVLSCTPTAQSFLCRPNIRVGSIVGQKSDMSECVCGTAVARWAKVPLSSCLSSLCFTPLRPKFNPRTGQRPYVWKVSSVTCRRSVVSSGYSGFLHQITDFIIIISPPLNHFNATFQFLRSSVVILAVHWVQKVYMPHDCMFYIISFSFPGVGITLLSSPGGSFLISQLCEWWQQWWSTGGGPCGGGGGIANRVGTVRQTVKTTMLFDQETVCSSEKHSVYRYQWLGWETVLLKLFLFFD